MPTRPGRSQASSACACSASCHRLATRRGARADGSKLRTTRQSRAHVPLARQRRRTMTTEFDFDNAVAAIAQAQATPDAVRVAQAELAPVRARALAALDEFNKTVARLRPFFDAAVDTYNRAYRVGVAHPELDHTLTEALKCMPGGPNALTGIINE